MAVPVKRLGRFSVVIVLLTAALVGFVTLSSIHVLPAGLRFHVGQIFPEGWELFVAGPSAPRFRTAVVRDGRWISADRGPMSGPDNAFGLNRAVRWQSVEVRRLVEEVPQLSQWTPCERAPLRCLARAQEHGAASVTNRTPYQTLCGRAGLIRELIFPPGERGSDGADVQTTHVIVLDVRC